MKNNVIANYKSRQAVTVLDKDRWVNAASIFFVTAVLGWALEVILNLFYYGTLIDSGNSILPINPLYGVCLGVMYLLLGTPRELHAHYNIKKPTHIWVSYIRYFLLTTLLIAGLELFVGLACEAILGKVLWDFSALPFSLVYISLPTSIMWGLFASIGMPFVKWLSSKLLGMLSKYKISRVYFLMFTILAIDIIISYSFLQITGSELRLFNIKLF